MNTLATALLAISLLTAALPLVPHAADASGPAPPTVKFGMEAGSVDAQAAAGVKPDYGTFWVGPWTLASGWNGPDAQMAKMRSAGVTPAIHFYYWGDDISPSCVENGCWSSLHDARKDRAGWERLGQELTDHLNAKMGGQPVLIFLESEFNKGGIEQYEPFDGYLADMALRIQRDYPAAEVVLGFGNWGSVHWGNFDRAAAASDMVGIQGMRGSTRQTEAQMYSLYDGLLAGLKSLDAKFPGKAKMITDVAVSSHPEPEYLAVQAGVLGEVFDNLETLKAHGVQAIIYRSWRDSPSMDLANYYGEAERHWGLTWSGTEQKPAGKVWVDGVRAERAGTTPPPPPPPAPIAVGDGTTTEAEAFAVREAGGLQSDAAASGGKAWNLWSNGALVQSYTMDGRFDLTLRVRGTSANGVAPHMDLYVGGAKVASADPGRAYTDVPATVTASGATEVRIVFTNDVRTSTEDRNLIVDTLRITPANAAPVASFTADTTDLTVRLDGSASSDADGDALAYTWSLGDGATGTGATASHTYAAAGTYTVTLTVRDARSDATASRTVTATEPNRAPAAAFTATVQDLRVDVDAASSSDPDGDALAHTWDFGDGTSATGRTASHTYAAAGTYTVTLLASDGRLSGTARQSVTAVEPNRAPSARFTSAPSGLSASFDARGSSDPDGDALTYAWSFGDGATGTGATATHTYAKAGTYTATLTASDGRLSGTASQVVTVAQPNRAPTASFTALAQGLAGSFDAAGSQDADGDPLTYTWRFGDGATATGRTASRTYAQAGTYTVQLTVSDGKAAATATRTVTVTAPATFTPAAGANEWWVEVRVGGITPVKVEAHANGAWTTLDKKSWGGWAKSFHVAKGTPVTFRATDAAGRVETSATEPWLGPAPTPFTATFGPRSQSNPWWVETTVSANKPLAGVDARVNGGAWVPLDAKSWGSWAKSLRVDDARVEFRATATTGERVQSGPYAWG